MSILPLGLQVICTLGPASREVSAPSHRSQIAAALRVKSQWLPLAPALPWLLTPCPPCPAQVPILCDMLRAGMNVARFNFSHGSHEYHQETLNNLRTACRETGIMAAVMLDTKGPEIRTGFLENGKSVSLAVGETVTITTDYTTKGNKNLIAMR